jgi:hypothetical protein
MKLNDIVIHAGRRYRLRGLDPVSVVPRHAYVEDVTTGELEEVSLDELKPLIRVLDSGKNESPTA